MGALHPIEQYLTFALAFGPFVLLGIVMWVRRRQDAAREGVSPERSGPEKSGAEQSGSEKSGVAAPDRPGAGRG